MSDDGATIDIAAQFGNIRLDPEGAVVDTSPLVADVLHSEIELTASMLTRSATNHNYYKGGDRAQQAKPITLQNEWQLGVFDCSPNAGITYEFLNDQLEVGRQGVLTVQGSLSLVPAADNIVKAFFIPGIPLTPEGGTVGEAKQYDFTTEASGGVERFTAPVAVPANLVATPVSATEIGLTWDADPEPLVAHGGLFRVLGYDLYRSLVTGGPAGDPYVKVNTLLIPASQSGNSFLDTALTTATAYFYVVQAIGNFTTSDVSGFSAEDTATTL